MRLVSTLLLFAMLFVFGLGSMVLAEGTVATQEMQEPQTSPVYEQMMSEYYMLVGDYFDVSYDEVADVLQTGIADDELAVAFFIASNTEASATSVAQNRVMGEPWHNIYQNAGLYSQDFWMPISGKLGKQAFGRLADIYKGQWNARLLLTDKEVVNLVNVKLLRDMYPKKGNEMVALRADGCQFAYIYNKSISRAANNDFQLAQENN